MLIVVMRWVTTVSRVERRSFEAVERREMISSMCSSSRLRGLRQRARFGEENGTNGLER